MSLIGDVNVLLDRFYIGNDNLLEIFNLQDEATLKFVNDGQVNVTMKDTNGIVLLDGGGGSVFPLRANYISGSDGNYKVSIPDVVAVAEGNIYWIEISAAQTLTGVDGFWRIKVIATSRGKT